MSCAGLRVPRWRSRTARIRGLGRRHFWHAMTMPCGGSHGSALIARGHYVVRLPLVLGVSSPARLEFTEQCNRTVPESLAAVTGASVGRLYV